MTPVKGSLNPPKGVITSMLKTTELEAVRPEEFLFHRSPLSMVTKGIPQKKLKARVGVGVGAGALP